MSTFLKTFQACYSTSTLVTFISTLTEIIFIGGWIMKRSFIQHVNRLITKGQAKIVAKAAQILVTHDQCDDLFFQQLLKEKNLSKDSGVVEIGRYAVCVVKEPISRTRTIIQEVKIKNDN